MHLNPKITLAVAAGLLAIGGYALLSLPPAVAPTLRLLALLSLGGLAGLLLVAGGWRWAAGPRHRRLEQLHAHRTATPTQLMTERNRIASAVNALDEGLLLLDENRRVIVANPVMGQLLGIPVDQLVGQASEELAARSALFGQLLRYLDLPADQREPSPEFTLPQGPPDVYYQLLAHDVRGFNQAPDQQAPAGAVLTLRNVSDHKKLDQVKWRFLATVSQDLQTPLSQMQLSLQRLQDSQAGPLTAEQQNIVYTLARENKHLLKLVGELLDVSRLELGTIQLNFQPVRLPTLVQFVADTIRPQLQPKRLVLDIQVPEALPAVRADLEKTTWVLLSLLANAIRYAHMQDRVRIKASLSADGQQVCVGVQDQGPGIAPEQQERIFERFSQIPKQSGSGLGLSIAREFVASQGGRLWVESVVGQGSTFWLTLPRAATA